MVFNKFQQKRFNAHFSISKNLNIKMEKRYKGLSNIGATCYMNSLLQTLFMTPEFRYGIYKWKYNEKIHPKQSDSIIFQLQKLFAKLQIDFPNEVTPKQLVKSFQWQDEEAQMQQDIQQFNRLLFQALQKSLSTKSEKYIHQNFVKDYFEGQLIHYTKCYECQNQSAREEYFQDLIITVKNIYQKVYNGTLQLGIQRYIKPQILDENNLYDCSNCEKKTKAQRGARFITMPSLLNIIFQRFTFNYFTMERQKVNDRVEFPFILNFNDYIEGYDKIPTKRNEDSSEYFKGHSMNEANGKIAPPKFSNQNKTTRTAINKKNTIPSVAGKIKTKPSAITKGFLAEMRKKKNMSSQQNQDLFYLNGNGTSSEQKIQNHQQKALSNSKSDDKNSPKQQRNTHLKNQLQHEQLNLNKQPTINELSQNVKQSDINHAPNLNLPPPPPFDLLPADLSVPFKLIQNTGNQSIQAELQKKILQQQKFDCQKQKQLLQLEEKNKQKVKKYLQQGPLVYELYAVLVHNGTANHGHYYSYIKSFQDQKWYCFNDQRVTLINVLEIQKTFGNANSNAYALYYRKVTDQNNKQDHSFLSKHKQTIPEYITQRINHEKKQVQQKQQLKMDNLSNVIVLKIYYQLYVKQLEIYKSNTLELVLEKARELFNIPAQFHKKNNRLRMFNPASEMKLQTFGGKQHLSLEELKIGSYKSLLLEIKRDEQVFEQYQAGAVALRLAFLEQNQNLNSLDQSHLKLHKITLKKNLNIKEIISLISQKRIQVLLNNQKSSESCSQQTICLIKRHMNNDESIHEVISIQDNLSKFMDDLTILENQILFIEPHSQNLHWPIEFENQIYRITIRYNKPSTIEYQSYLTDSRISVQSLKNELCMFLEVNPEDIIMRWGTKSGRQLKDMAMTLKQARFITGTQIYFDLGIPAKSGQIRIQLYMATDAAPQTFNRLHEFQYLTQVPISGSLKASQVKQKFVKVIKKLKDISLKPQQFRIRQRVSDKIGKIYRQKPMKEQQLIQKRQIAIELIPDQNLDVKQFSIYFRIWDQQNWQLGKKIEVVLNKNTTVKQLAETLSMNGNDKTLKQTNEMCICRILSIHKFNIIDLTQMEWFPMNQQAPVIGQPMFVNADGLLYIVKNGNEQPRPLTKEEEKRFGGTVKPAVIRNKPRSYQPKQAKSMRIKVIQKQEELSQSQQQFQTQNLVQKQPQQK